MRGFDILSLVWVYIRAVFLVRRWEGLVAATGSLICLAGGRGSSDAAGTWMRYQVIWLAHCLIWIGFSIDDLSFYKAVRSRRRSSWH